MGSIDGSLLSDSRNEGKISSEDEDRKFLRAAAEAIVATSMNSQIDPTILELLKRIQYASNDQTRSQRVNRVEQQNEQSQNIYQNGNNQLQNSNQLTDTGISGFNAHDDLFNTSNLINPTRTSTQTHFPTFNLSYFDNLAGTSITSTTSATSTNTSNITSEGNNSWSSLSNNMGISHQRHNSITTPNSITSTPPGSNTSPSSINLQLSQSSSLLQTNGSEKPFVCKDCSLSFRRSSDLRRHQRAHLPILPHICQLCGKGFARKDALKRHSDTLTCKRNREKLLNSGGDIDTILAQTNGEE